MNNLKNEKENKIEFKDEESQELYNYYFEIYNNF